MNDLSPAEAFTNGLIDAGLHFDAKTMKLVPHKMVYGDDWCDDEFPERLYMPAYRCMCLMTDGIVPYHFDGEKSEVIDFKSKDGVLYALKLTVNPTKESIFIEVLA